MGGLGLQLGLNAVGNVGRDMRDYRQEGEIRETMTELQKSQMREQQLEQRLQALEQGQVLQQQQPMPMQQQQQQVLPPVAAAPALK